MDVPGGENRIDFVGGLGWGLVRMGRWGGGNWIHAENTERYLELRDI